MLDCLVPDTNNHHNQVKAVKTTDCTFYDLFARVSPQGPYLFFLNYRLSRTKITADSNNDKNKKIDR